MALDVGALEDRRELLGVRRERVEVHEGGGLVGFGGVESLGHARRRPAVLGMHPGVGLPAPRHAHARPAVRGVLVVVAVVVVVVLVSVVRVLHLVDAHVGVVPVLLHGSLRFNLFELYFDTRRTPGPMHGESTKRIVRCRGCWIEGSSLEDVRVLPVDLPLRARQLSLAQRVMK